MQGGEPSPLTPGYDKTQGTCLFISRKIMTQTSVHVKPVTGGSEAHNKRTKELDYVRPELSHKNESWEKDSINERLAHIKRTYKESTGQRLQKKATPIRESVIVISKGTTIEQLQNLAKGMEEKFGIKTFQIHIHRDEGHHKSRDEWKENLHAHLVHDWTDEKGKTLKLDRFAMAELQTMAAEALSMERGKSSEKKHLEPLQFKNLAEQEKAAKLQAEVKEASKTIERIKEPISAEIQASIEKKMFGRGEVAKVDKNDLKQLVLSKQYFEELAEKEKSRANGAEAREREKDKIIDGYRSYKDKTEGEIQRKADSLAISIVNELLKKMGINKQLGSDFKLRDINPRQQGRNTHI